MFELFFLFSLSKIVRFFFYILQSEKDGSYYLGQTSNLQDRLKRHNQGRSRYTKNRGPWKLVYQESFTSRSEAVRREQECKRKHSREFIEALINDPENTG